MAIRFDANADVLTRTTNLPSITAFTLMGWVYRVAANGTTQYETFLSLGTAASEYAIYINNNTTAGSWAVTEWSADYVGSALATATWYHLAMTCAGTGAGQLLGYMNGVLDITGNGGSASAETLRINGGPAATVEWMSARVAGVKIYAAVLTQNEIAAEMRSLTPVRLANLNGWYPFLADTDVADHSSNLNAWTVGGTLTTEDGPPVPWSIARYVGRRIPASGVGTTTATITPAYVKWQARTPAFIRVLLPTRWQWRAQVVLQTRTASVLGAKSQWLGQATSMTRTLRPGSARLRWQGNILVLPRTVPVLVARMQWQAIALRTGGLVVITTTHVRWQAQAGVAHRGGVSGGRRGYFLGMQRGYPRRQGVLV